MKHLIGAPVAMAALAFGLATQPAAAAPGLTDAVTPRLVQRGIEHATFWEEREHKPRKALKKAKRSYKYLKKRRHHERAS